MQKLITNGKIVLESEIISADLLIDGEKIVAISPKINNPAAEIFDASGCYILPGFIDIHTHLADNIGRFRLADDYASGSEVAVINGITTIYSFITQHNNENLSSAIQRTLPKAEKQTHCDYGWHLTPTDFSQESWQEIDEAVKAGYTTFKFYTTYKAAGIFSSYEQLEQIYQHFAKTAVLIMIHCEDDSIIAEQQTKYIDYANAYTHALQRPSIAESKAALTIVELCRKYQVRTHFVHVSSPETVKAVKKAAVGLPLTLETCPQYLYLNEEELKKTDGHRFLCSPPLRSLAESAELNELVKNNQLDIFATDHCPYTKADKDDWRNDIRQAGNGLAGLGALPHLFFKLFEPINDENILKLSRHLSLNAAKTINLYPQKGVIQVGADADLLIINPNGKNQPIRSTLADCYDPYSDFNTNLEIKKVFLRGNLVAENGELTNKKTGRQLNIPLTR